MKVAAIISEYNPFHTGHKYLVDETRSMLGEDTAIVAIMSGNYTQRGEIAITDKTVRAKAAVKCGINLVLEIPFPFSVSSAEFYAKSGIHIANSLGTVDYLVFGSESGNISDLKEVASNMLTNKFTEALTEELSVSAGREGYPETVERIYRELFGDAKSFLSSPNNTLGIEYLKALVRSKSSIVPITVKRKGAGYSDSINESYSNQSASAIRNLLLENNQTAFNYLPQNALSVFNDALRSGIMPSRIEKLDSAVIANLRINSANASEGIHDANGGLYNRLLDGSRKTNGIEALSAYAGTKKYTDARIMRAIWYSFFGVTSSEVNTLPKYTQVLAMDKKGCALLRSISKISKFPVITKPSSYRRFGDAVIKQKERADIADSIYYLSLDNPPPASFALTFTPYVKK